MQFFGNTNFPFLKYRRMAFAFSGIIILAGIISLIFHKGPAMGIDFTGGTLVELKFEQNVEQSIDIQKIRSALDKIGLGESTIQLLGGQNQVLIRTGNKTKGNESEIGELIASKLKEAFPAANFETLRSEFIGPAVGVELQQNALWAILASLVGILAYVGWRFEFRFAVGAVIALIHDVLITLGFFSFLNKEMSITVLAAFLTLIGYSINDTIVVFDRIRENMRLVRNKSFEEIIDLSINQTLSRTIITSLTVMLVVVILFFWGGAVIHDFAFALIIGVFFGTYSSIFIASPILVEWRSTAKNTSQKKFKK